MLVLDTIFTILVIAFVLGIVVNLAIFILKILKMCVTMPGSKLPPLRAKRPERISIYRRAGRIYGRRQLRRAQ